MINLEILAPAGDISALRSALASGADAVYFGLTTLNARRRAANFAPEDLADTVALIHSHQARAYLTLNIDLTDREIGQAVRVLDLAAKSGVDAVLVKDPALLAFREDFPNLEFHFSTQASICNSLDLQAAAELGIKRVVLSRECSLEEIKIASAVNSVESEVFAQGALCFSISGHCLLSSWGGGRSGNRGCCTSPCRVPWSVDGIDTCSTPLSMHDLAVVDRLKELSSCGVNAIKIEGRLKSAKWVGEAVTLYKDALEESDDTEHLWERAKGLAAYTGREISSDYLDGKYEKQTGVAARKSSSAESAKGMIEDNDKKEITSDDEKDGYKFSIQTVGKQLVCSCSYNGHEDSWSMPKSVVKRKFISIKELFEQLAESAIQDLLAIDLSCDDLSFLLPQRNSKKIISQISVALHKMLKNRKQPARSELASAIRDKLRTPQYCDANKQSLTSIANTVRLEIKNALEFMKNGKVNRIVIEGVERAADLQDLLTKIDGNIEVIIALPTIFFEERVPLVNDILALCQKHKLLVEVNSWGGWFAAKSAGVAYCGGSGLGIYNCFAGEFLASLGFKSATVGIEVDQAIMEALGANCPLPLDIIAFGRPALLSSRAVLDDSLYGKVFEDRRDISIKASREQGMTIFRPTKPFNLCGVRNSLIRANNIVVDLCGSSDPLQEWEFLQRSQKKGGFLFNYDRTLA